MLRVLLIPVFVVFMMLTPDYSWCRFAAAGVFVAASLTDLLDGKIARKYNMVTNFGKFMDPLADKLLVCTALICFVHFHMIPTWIVIVIVAREFIISGFRLVAAEKGLVLAASKLAKVKTTFQMIMIVVLILGFEFMKIPAQVLIYLSLVLTVLSLIEYLVKNRSVLKEEEK